MVKQGPFRPFCCECCKNSYFYGWATEEYTVLAVDQSEEDGENKNEEDLN